MPICNKQREITPLCERNTKREIKLLYRIVARFYISRAINKCMIESSLRNDSNFLFY